MLAAGTAGCARSRPESAPSAPVVVAFPHGPSSLDPDLAAEELTLNVLTNVYETLVAFDAGMSLAPGLAESWYVEDELRWVFRLPDPLPRLHDGRTLDARLVAASLERSRTSASSKRRGQLTAVAAIEARDPRTLVIRTAYPVAALANRLASVHVWVEPREPGAPPVGTGPYRVKAWTQGGATVLEAFDAYRGRPPTVRVLEFRVVPGAQDRLAQVRSGSAHLVLDVEPEALGPVASDPAVRVVAQKGLRVLFLGMDCARRTSADVSAGTNPFRDVRVRRAAALAIDKAALVREGLGGHAEPLDQLVAPHVFGYSKDLPAQPFDLAAARRLMAQAGHARGFEVALDFMPEKYVAMSRVVAVLARQLEAVGIRLRLRPAPAAEFFARLDRHETALYLMGWVASSGDAGLSYDFLLHSPGEGRGSQNGGGYASPEVDGLLDRAARTVDDSARKELLAAVAETVAADVPTIPLYRQTDLYVVSRDLDFEPTVLRSVYGARMRRLPPSPG
jgi:peptide/nickel transport system substrate-binding protein